MGREEEGWTGNLGLADVNCYVKNGLKKEWIDYKFLLYSTRNYIPFPVTSHTRINE